MAGFKLTSRLEDDNFSIFDCLIVSLSQMLLTVLDELEGLKPEFQRQFQAIGEVQVTAQPYQVNNLENHRYRPVGNSFGQPSTSNKASSYYDNQWVNTLFFFR